MLKAPLYTSALLYGAVQTAFLAFLFSYYDIEIPVPDLKPATNWLYEKVDNLDWFDSVLHFRSRNDQNIRKTKNPDQILEDRLTLDLPVMTKEQLGKYDGVRGAKGLYLAILGKVFDVKKGKKHYGPGGGYHFFTGKDATRAFVSGDFSPEGLRDDLDGLTHQDMLGIEEWMKFYEKDYGLVALLAGTYYDDSGRPTERLKAAVKAIAAAHKWQEGQKKETEIFPPCNSEWHKDQGGRVWCTNKSGGITRDWSGVPRRLYKPGSKDFRCACVKNFGVPLSEEAANSAEAKNRGDLSHPNLREYDNCSPTSMSCRLPNND